MLQPRTTFELPDEWLRSDHGCRVSVGRPRGTVLVGAKPSGETMAIKLVDASHLTGVVKMNRKLENSLRAGYARRQGGFVPSFNPPEVPLSKGGRCFHQTWRRNAA